MRRLPLLLLLLSACGGGDDATDAPDASVEPDAGGTPRERIGWIDVVEDRYTWDDSTEWIETRSSLVRAQFYADHPPGFHQVEMTSGACELSRYTPASCDPACVDGLCVDTNVCEPWPTLRSAGRLTVTGLNATVTIDPKQGYYYPSEQLPEDLFADGARVTAALAGADLPAMSLVTDGVPPIEPEITYGKITMIPGQDFTLRWDPVGVGRVRVTLNSNNQGHGMPYLGIIVCDVDDDAGELTIPAVIHDAFPETQAWTICAGTDCPQSTIRRYRRDGYAIGDDQEIELTVTSQYSFGVDHNFPD